MFRKTLISLAVASTVGLSGCLDDGSNTKNANPSPNFVDTNFDASLARPVFNPLPTSGDFAIPTSFDLSLLLGASQSANYDFTGYTTNADPASAAVADLAGFSTNAQINIPFNHALNPATVKANQTIFLVPLNSNPVSADLSEIELTANPSYIDTTNPFDAAGLADVNFRAETVSLDGGTNNVLRITPLEPLADQTKFLVIVTNGVKGADGRATGQSKTYQRLLNDDIKLETENFESIKTIVELNQTLAEGFLASQSVDADVTLAYTMTTENTKTTFNALVSPATYLTQLGQEVVLYSALAVVSDSLEADATASDKFAALADALSDSPENAALAQAVGQAIGPYVANPSLVSSIVQSAIPSLPSLPVLSAPTTKVQFYPSTMRTADTLAAIAGSGNATLQGAAAKVEVSEGAIELPYYLKLPGSDGSGITAGMWRGSTTVETALNDAIDTQRGTYPSLVNFAFPRDSDGTFNVTQYMPFPQENAKVVAPVTVFYPTAAAGCGTGASITDVVIFQHGITVDRSAATIPAVNFAAQGAASLGKCVMTVAIDQPLHGLGGATVGTVPGLKPLSTYVNNADFPDADYIGERHFYYSSPEGQFSAQKQTDITKVRSGSLFINLQSLQTNRDNLRQGVMDLFNLATVIKSGNFDVDGSGTDFAATDLQGATFHFAGHSLGGITGTVFASLAENPTLRGAYGKIGSMAMYPDFTSTSLMNTGGQLTKLVENSPSFGPTVLAGLASAGASQGSSDLESYLYVFQSTVDSVDPVNQAKLLGGNGSNVLFSEVIGDLTVPNQANVNTLGRALSAPMAGTEPLMALFDLGKSGGTGTLADGNDLSLLQSGSVGAPSPAASFFVGTNPCADARHGTFVAPATPEDPKDTVCPAGSDTADAFAEMITEVLANISGGGAIPVNDATLLGDSPTIEKALDQDQ